MPVENHPLRKCFDSFLKKFIVYGYQESPEGLPMMLLTPTCCISEQLSRTSKDNHIHDSIQSTTESKLVEKFTRCLLKQESRTLKKKKFIK